MVGCQWLISHKVTVATLLQPRMKWAGARRNASQFTMLAPSAWMLSGDVGFAGCIGNFAWSFGPGIC